ncbi:hypothetical protein ACQ4PT_060079 [Festuca glaucescens]
MAALRHLAGATHNHRIAANSSSLFELQRPPSCLAVAAARPLRLAPLRSRSPTRLYALSSNDIKVGINLEVDGAPWKILGNKLNPSSFTSVPAPHRITLPNSTTFEESRLNESDVGDKQKWLKEGMDCILLYWNGRIIDFDLPITVRLTVIETDPGQGDSAQGGTKPATLETGAVINVPSFVDVGDDVLIDSRTGQYMSRA